MDYLTITRSCFTEINREKFYKLAERGHKVGMVYPEKLLFENEYKTHDPVINTTAESYPLPAVFDNPRITLFKGLGKLIKQQKPKYVYTEYDPASLLGVYLSVLSLIYNYKLLFISCENLSLRLPQILKREGIKGLLVGIFKNITVWLTRIGKYHVAVLSDDGIQVFKEKGYKSLSKIHLGFDARYFNVNPDIRKEIRNQLGIPDDKIVIAYFGRIVPEKGVDTLLEALNLIKERDWIFLIDEFKQYENEYAKTIKNMISDFGIENRTIFFDADHYEIAKYMNASDIAVVPSKTTKKWKEQFGRIAPEAMSCGNAVIASDSGTLKEIVTNYGLIFKEGNYQDLADKLNYLLDNQEKIKELGQKCAARAAEKYTIDKEVELVLEM